MYSFIVLIIIIVIGFLVCKRNYKNRASHINGNLLEFCYHIVVEFEKLNYDQRIKFKDSLTPKELDLFDGIITRNISLGKNLNILQNHMFNLESIMKKLKAQEN
ncbi:hypothetical protein [Clostridium subterminale]|uniref:Uncharacterized protein n=1 Tax=Clostridium subterminale TaxID=1550 RepID=A0ABN1KXN9_CLOSU